MDGVEVKYGRIDVEGEKVGYAVWEKEGKRHEIIVPDYKNLKKIIDGKFVKPTREDVMIWTQVAGDMGTAELLSYLKK